MRVCQPWEEGQVAHCSPTSKVIHEGMHSVNLETSQHDFCQPEACTRACMEHTWCIHGGYIDSGVFPALELFSKQ